MSFTFVVRTLNEDFFLKAETNTGVPARLPLVERVGLPQGQTLPEICRAGHAGCVGPGGRGTVTVTRRIKGREELGRLGFL